MKNPFKNLRYHLSLQSAIDEGFAYKPKPPVLDPKKKKELMAASSLETPRSNTRAILGVLKPYFTEASPKERIFAISLLVASLTLNKFSVDMTVDFGNWLSTMTNTVAQLWQVVSTSRPDIIADIVDHYPLVQDALNSFPQLNDMMMTYPDVTQILQNPEFKDLISQNPELLEALQKNPTMEDLFMQHPGFAEKVAANPELLDQLSNFKNDLGTKLKELPAVKKVLSDLVYICGGAFIENSWDTLTSTFNAATHALQGLGQSGGAGWDAAQSQLNDKAAEALQKTWASKDMTTIALKFTAAAIAAYKSSQFLALRWRSWSTGYYTSKWTQAKSFMRLKNTFNNIDNPGQRIQEDPEKFTMASVSLATGVASAGMTLAAFGGMLWGMGPVMGVTGGFFWIGASYAASVLGLTFGAGYKLPWIYRNKQRVEANLRRTTDSIHNNADQIALANSEDIEKELVQKRMTPVMKNSVREIGTQVKLIVVDATIGNVSIPLPYVVASFAAVASGTASFGTVQTLNYAFNRVNSSLSFIVNRYEQLSNWFATAQRIFAMDQTVDAAHYIDTEKQAQSDKVAKQLQAPKPPAPGGKT